MNKAKILTVLSVACLGATAFGCNNSKQPESDVVLKRPNITFFGCGDLDYNYVTIPEFKKDLIINFSPKTSYRRISDPRKEHEGEHAKPYVGYGNYLVPDSAQVYTFEFNQVDEYNDIWQLKIPGSVFTKNMVVSFSKSFSSDEKVRNSIVELIDLSKEYAENIYPIDTIRYGSDNDSPYPNSDIGKNEKDKITGEYKEIKMPLFVSMIDYESHGHLYERDSDDPEHTLLPSSGWCFYNEKQHVRDFFYFDDVFPEEHYPDIDPGDVSDHSKESKGPYEYPVRYFANSSAISKSLSDEGIRVRLQCTSLHDTMLNLEQIVQTDYRYGQMKNFKNCKLTVIGHYKNSNKTVHLEDVVTKTLFNNDREMSLLFKWKDILNLTTYDQIYDYFEIGCELVNNTNFNTKLKNNSNNKVNEILVESAPFDSNGLQNYFEYGANFNYRYNTDALIKNDSQVSNKEYNTPYEYKLPQVNISAYNVKDDGSIETIYTTTESIFNENNTKTVTLMDLKTKVTYYVSDYGLSLVPGDYVFDTIKEKYVTEYDPITGKASKWDVREVPGIVGINYDLVVEDFDKACHYINVDGNRVKADYISFTIE